LKSTRFINPLLILIFLMPKLKSEPGLDFGLALGDE